MIPNVASQHPGRLAGAIVLVMILAVAAAAERVPVPTPPGGGLGVNVFPVDQLNPLDLPEPGPVAAARLDGPASPASRGNIGGDDVVIDQVVYTYDRDLAVASDGTLFAVHTWSDQFGDDMCLMVLRSTDGGTTWDEWATLDDPDPTHAYCDARIHVAEGDQDRVFVAYSFDPGDGFDSEIHVAWSPLHQATGDFAHDTLLHSGSRVASWSFTTDAEIFSAYYAYIVFSVWDSVGGADIHFARSINMGDSWEASYTLGAITVGDRGYYAPSVAIGYGGYVHVAWYLGFADDHEYDDALRYRRAPNYAGGGLGSWEGLEMISNHTNGVDECVPTIGASRIGPEVVLASLRQQRTAGDPYWDGFEVRDSDDEGASWDGPVQVGEDYVTLGDLVHQEATGRWLLGIAEGWYGGFRWAPVADPTSWSVLQDFTDEPSMISRCSIVLDPARGDRVGVLFDDRDGSDFVWIFDAEWRTDPGYPVTEPGFPVTLPSEPISDPAVVDVDGDGDLEIVLGDTDGRIRIYRADGTLLPGWPRDVGGLSASPIAVGDLNGDGVMTVVAGGDDGRIHALTPTGQYLDGFPHQTPYTDPVYLAIGAIGGPYPRAIVWGCGPRLYAIDHHGQPYPGVLGRGFGSRTFTHPPAIGDIDGDGRSEVVMGIADDVFAFQLQESGTELSWYGSADLSGPVALGDFDLDGDVEIVVPLANGVMHVLEGDGTEYPGAWPLAAAVSELNGVAIASCLGNNAPEIAVSARNWYVTVLWENGSVGTGWPANTDGWYIHGLPIIGELVGSNDVIVGARGYRGWSWDNAGNVNPGWPKTFGDHVYRTPAYGDLDQDGSAEVVFATEGQLTVVDVNNPPSSGYRLWAMAGHDPERSGCADCPLDLVPVADDPDRVTRVSMAAPHPNPIAGAASFAFAVPVRSIAELAIHDVRGRRVALVRRAEVPAGRHVFEWNGRDGDGRPVASGQYLATLRVRGPGVDETITRKVTVLR